MRDTCIRVIVTRPNFPLYKVWCLRVASQIWQMFKTQHGRIPIDPSILAGHRFIAKKIRLKMPTCCSEATRAVTRNRRPFLAWLTDLHDSWLGLKSDSSHFLVTRDSDSSHRVQWLGLGPVLDPSDSDSGCLWLRIDGKMPIAIFTIYLFKKSRSPSWCIPYCLFPGCMVTWAWSLAKGQKMVS